MRFSLGRSTVTETSWKLVVAEASVRVTVMGMTRSLDSPEPEPAPDPEPEDFSVGVPTEVIFPAVFLASGSLMVTAVPATASFWSESLRLASTTWVVEVTSKSSVSAATRSPTRAVTVPTRRSPGVKTIRPSGRVPVRGRSRSFCHFRMALVVAQLKWSSGS